MAQSARLFEAIAERRLFAMAQSARLFEAIAQTTTILP
jgi:hypothetical protein